MSEIKRYRPTVTEVKATAYCGAHPDGEYVSFADHAAAIAALEADCHIIARRTLEHWSEKAALSSGKTEGDKG